MSDKLQEIKQLANNAVVNGTGHVDLTTYALTWLISQLEQAQAEEEELEARMEQAQFEHFRWFDEAQKLQTENEQLKAELEECKNDDLEKERELDKLRAENAYLHAQLMDREAANQKLVECLEWYGDPKNTTENQEGYKDFSSYEFDQGYRAIQALKEIRGDKGNG